MAAPANNKNAQKWTLEAALELFNKSIELAKRKTDYAISGQKIEGFEFHYIGEIASTDEIDQYSGVYLYLKNTFPECEILYNKLLTRMESNCFFDTKKGIIREATGIFNLKANHKWSERTEIDMTSGGDKITQPTWIIADNSKKDE
jgi:hypothetical protein